MKADCIACKTTSSVVFHFRLHWWIWFFPKLLLHYYLHHTLLLSSLRIFSVTVNTKIWKRSEDHRFFFPEYSNNFFYIKHVLIAVILKKLVLPKKVLWSIVDLLTSFIILEYILIMLLLAGIEGHQFISFH